MGGQRYVFNDYEGENAGCKSRFIESARCKTSQIFSFNYPKTSRTASCITATT